MKIILRCFRTTPVSNFVSQYELWLFLAPPEIEAVASGSIHHVYSYNSTSDLLTTQYFSDPFGKGNNTLGFEAGRIFLPH